jgi:N-acetylglucosamine-6-phosphate deacetylase
MIVKPMLIRDIWVLDHNNKYLKDIFITSDGTITDDFPHKNSTHLFEAAGEHFFFPGLLDAHVHGYGGHDFADAGHDPQALPVILKALGTTGLSYTMATLISLDLHTLESTLKALDLYIQQQENHLPPGSTKIVGVHLEGPFIAKNCKGAHKEENLQAEINMQIFKKIISAAPHIKHWKVTLAPDLRGAEEFLHDVKKLEEEHIYVKISLGHSNPQDKTIITKTINAGAIGFTHLGNACGESLAREKFNLQKQDMQSQLVRWVLENPDLCPHGVELIVDGIHLSQPFVNLIRDTIGDKLMLITDALGPSGCQRDICKYNNSFYLTDDNGQFRTKQITSADGQLREEKILAGSAASLAQCMQQYIAWLDHLNADEKMQSLFASVITNPRTTSLSNDAIKKLPDKKNGVILNKKGEIKWSVCNGLLQNHF